MNRGQIGVRSFHQQVEMVSYQDPGVNPPIVAFAHLAQAGQESFLVPVILETTFPP